jgi:hypothetical protein
MYRTTRRSYIEPLRGPCGNVVVQVSTHLDMAQPYLSRTLCRRSLDILPAFSFVLVVWSSVRECCSSPFNPFGCITALCLSNALQAVSCISMAFNYVLVVFSVLENLLSITALQLEPKHTRNHCQHFLFKAIVIGRRHWSWVSVIDRSAPQCYR